MSNQLEPSLKPSSSHQSSSRSLQKNSTIQFSQVIQALAPHSRTQQNLNNFLTFLSQADFNQMLRDYLENQKKKQSERFEQNSRQLKRFHRVFQNLTRIQQLNLDLAIANLEQIENKNCKSKCFTQILIFLNLLVIMFFFYSVVGMPIFSRVSDIVDNSKCQLFTEITNQAFSYNSTQMCEPVLKQISAEVKKQNLCGPNIIKIVELSIFGLIIIIALVMKACCGNLIKKQFRKLTRTFQKE